MDRASIVLSDTYKSSKILIRSFASLTQLHSRYTFSFNFKKYNIKLRAFLLFWSLFIRDISWNYQNDWFWTNLWIILVKMPNINKQACALYTSIMISRRSWTIMLNTFSNSCTFYTKLMEQDFGPCKASWTKLNHVLETLCWCIVMSMKCNVN